MIDKIFDKISEYHIFNSLVPGMVFIIIGNYFLDFDIPTNNVIILFFEAYFLGIVISRVGSILIEDFLLNSFIKKYNYDDYIEACKSDSKIKILLQDCNMYRSFSSVFILILISKILITTNLEKDILFYIINSFLILLFAKSYLKQNNEYIFERVEKFKKNKNK